MTKIRMVRAVVYDSPFVAGRDQPVFDRRVNLFNLTDQEWLSSQLTDDDRYVTLTKS